MPENNFMFTDLSQPIELSSTEKTSIETGMLGNKISPYGDPSKMFGKTQVTVLGIDDQEKPREEHTWCLKDAENRSWTGRLEGGQRSKYVLFVNQGNEFKVIMVDKWYRFQPKIHYQVLNIEEAETKMEEKKSFGSDRWIMKGKKNERSESLNKLKEIRKLHDSEIWTEPDEVLAKRHADEEIDFEEVFDDDESEEARR